MKYLQDRNKLETGLTSDAPLHGWNVYKGYARAKLGLRGG